MKLIGLMPCRNESWIIGLSIRAALQWLDHLVVLNHASTDSTGAILEQIQRETGKLTIINEPNATWAEMGHRQRLLQEARKQGATHCAIVDSDEILSGNLLDWVRGQIACVPAGATLQVPMRNLYGSIEQYRVADGTIQGRTWGAAITTLAFADAPGLSWQPTNGYEHHHREPHGSRVGLRIYPEQLEGGVMHLQFADGRRLLAKHNLYKCDELLRWPGRRPVAVVNYEYSMAPNWQGATFAAVPDAWWEPYSEFLPHLDLKQEPWQESEVRRLIEQHGRERFAGLDLFGVA